MFDALFKDFFNKHSQDTHNLVACVRKYVKCWLSDGHYDSDDLESYLRDTFGRQKRMFGHSPGIVSGTKVAVTATSTSDAYSYLFANYNSKGRNTQGRFKSPCFRILLT